MKAATRRALLALSLSAALPRCASDPTDPTGVFVRLSVDPTLRTSVQRVVVRVFDADQAMAPPIGMPGVFSLGLQAEHTFVVRSTGVARRVRIEAEGYGRDAMMPEAMMPNTGVVIDRALVSYVQDQVVEVRLQLREACRAAGRMPCMMDQHCDAMGMCVSAVVQNPTRHVY